MHSLEPRSPGRTAEPLDYSRRRKSRCVGHRWERGFLVIAGEGPMGVKKGRPARWPSLPIGRSRGGRAFARHDVIATAVSPTCYFNACGAKVRHPRLVSVDTPAAPNRPCRHHAVRPPMVLMRPSALHTVFKKSVNLVTAVGLSVL